MHVGLASRGDYAFKKMFAVGCTWACEPDVNAAMWLQWDDVNSYVVAVAVAWCGRSGMMWAKQNSVGRMSVFCLRVWSA